MGNRNSGESGSPKNGFIINENNALEYVTYFDEVLQQSCAAGPAAVVTARSRRGPELLRCAVIHDVPGGESPMADAETKT
ncbi:MAG: hypothetical protein VW516_06225, partial [Rhodospirillaceae bacterium]